MAKVRIPIPNIGGMRQHGSPTLLQPDPEGVTECHELVNVDASSPGRVQGRPAARDGYEKGSAETADWPRFQSSSQ